MTCLNRLYRAGFVLSLTVLPLLAKANGLDTPLIGVENVDFQGKPALQYCSKSQNKEIVKLGLLSLISDKNKTVISGRETLENNKLKIKVTSHSSFFLYRNNVHFRQIETGNNSLLCAYTLKKELHYVD